MQTILNAIASAAIIAPAAVAFSLLFSLLRFANFAVGAFITVGAFGAWFANTQMGWPLWTAVPVGMIAASAVVTFCDWAIFKPIRAAAGTALLLVSVALAFVIENVLRFFLGSQIKAFDLPLSRPIDFGPVHLAPEILGVILISGGSLALVFGCMALLPWGRAIRAAADDPDLANARGINVARIHLLALVIGGLLIGLSGSLAGVDLAIEPGLGWTLTVPILAAAILGGIGSMGGAVAGAILVGLAEELSVMFLVPAYKAGVGFVVIALMLLLRPQGLFGRAAIRK